MSHLPKCALLSTAILLSSMILPVRAQPFEIKDRAELNAMIRDYIVSNPEILIEAQEALQAKEEARKRDAAQLAVVKEADALFSDPADAVYGNPDGDVTLVEFFDYNCPFCRRSM